MHIRETHQNGQFSVRLLLKSLQQMQSQNIPNVNKLARVATPALGKLFSSGTTKLGELDTQSLGAALEALFERLTPEQQDQMTEELLQGALVDGVPLWPQFNVHFQGRVREAFQLLHFSLKVNFGDFFKGLLAAAGSLSPKKPAEKPSTSPTT